MSVREEYTRIPRGLWRKLSQGKQIGVIETLQRRHEAKLQIIQKPGAFSGLQKVHKELLTS